MPAVGGYTNTSALFRAAVPQQSYAQLSAMKDRELQLAQYQEQKAQMDQQQNAALIEQQQNFRNEIKNLPMEAPDKQRIRLWVKEREKELVKHIENRYPNREGEYFKAESNIYMKNILSDLLNSDLYAVASANKENVFMAKQAIQKGENLTGEFGPDGKYAPAENQLLQYMEGKTPVFKFNGSYKPDAQFVYDHFGKQDNPYGSKYDVNAYAPERDVLNVLSGKLGDKNGKDMFYRQFMGRSVPYKRYSLEDQMLFNADMANKQSSIQARQGNLALGWARLAETKNKNAQDKKALDVIDQGIGNVLDSPIRNTQPRQIVGGDLTKVIKAIGKPLSAIMKPLPSSAGAQQWSAVSGLPVGAASMQFTELSGAQLGPLHTKHANLGKNGKVGEALTENGELINLDGIPHTIQYVNPNILVDQNEYIRTSKRNPDGSPIYPEYEFRQATVRIDKQYLDKHPEINTNGATPVMDDDPTKGIIGWDITLTVPSKGFFKSKEVQNSYNKQNLGQKIATQLYLQAPSIGANEFGSAEDDE